MNPVDSLHAILFVSDRPLSLEALAVATGLAPGQTEQALDLLRERLAREGPIQLVELAHGYQLATKAEFADLVTRYLAPQPQRLGKATLETLAIIAYKQPITIGEIEKLRGVQSDYGVRVLLEKRLVQELGRRQTPGRPVMYGTTDQFLHHFGLATLKELPEVTELRVNAPAADPTSEGSADDIH